MRAKFDEALAPRDRHIDDLPGDLGSMIESRATVEKRLLEAKIELAGKRELSS